MSQIYALIFGVTASERNDTAVERAWAWANNVHLTDSPQRGPLLFQQGWTEMESSFLPDIGDTVVMLYGDEFVFDYQMVKRSLALHPSSPMGFIVYHMWDENHYRTDSPFDPRFSLRVVPYRPGASWNLRAMDDQMIPEYARNMAPITKEIGRVLSYRYATEQERHAEYLWTASHYGQSVAVDIHKLPALHPWTEGSP